MKILILGSQGFIGSYLAGYFVSKGYEVTGCDLRDGAITAYVYHKMSILSSDFDTLFSNHNFDVCVNASGSGNVAYSFLHPISDFEANTYSVAKILDTIRKYNPSCKFLHISSAAVYGNPKDLPVKESGIIAPLSPYGYHKLASEELCREYCCLHKVPVTIIRPFSVYGNGLKKQLLWDICTKLKDSDSISLYGTGNESRDFIHISELAALIDIIITKSNFECNIYNAATGKETTIKQIADIFENNFGTHKKISFSGEKKEGDPINWKADIASSLELGFHPFANIESSVIDYISWFTSL